MIVRSVLAIALAISFVSASAYVPPSNFIVKRMAQKKKGLRSVWIRSIVTAYDERLPTDVHFREVTIYHFKKRILQSRAFDDDGRELYATERKLSSAQAIGGLGGTTPLLDFLLFEADPETLMLSLIKKKIPVQMESDLDKLPDEPTRRAAEKTFLMRWDDRVIWGIGNKTTLDKALFFPQLWIEKDSFVPIRYLFGEESRELRMEGTTFYGSFAYPREIGYMRNELPLFKSKVDKIVLSPKLKDFPSRLKPGYTTAGQSKGDSLRALINQYYTYMR